jgi:pimeloyl-ACP methyl ester carboxylesterase
MTEPFPIVLVPGLLTSPRLYAEQLPTLWQHGPVTIAGNTRDDTVTAIASRILADAPPRFALAGLSMGGYICFEMVRQAPDRVARLALLDTSARPDTPELTQRRQAQIALGAQRPLRRGRRPAVLPAGPPFPPR